MSVNYTALRFSFHGFVRFVSNREIKKKEEKERREGEVNDARSVGRGETDFSRDRAKRNAYSPPILTRARAKREREARRALPRAFPFIQGRLIKNTARFLRIHVERVIFLVRIPPHRSILFQRLFHSKVFPNTHVLLTRCNSILVGTLGKPGAN